MIANDKLVVGLTGTIASGKTAVAEFYRSHGFDIVDADIVSREVLHTDKVALKALQSEFPDCFEKDELLRAKLKAKVFNDSEKLQTLNSIMFPAIERRCRQLIDECEGYYVMLVAPLLFESGFDKMVDKTICVVCSYETLIERLMRRDNIDKELAEKIIKSQMDQKVKAEKSDYLVLNDGSKRDMEIYACRVLRQISVYDYHNNKQVKNSSDNE